MNTTLTSLGYDLYEVSDNCWAIHIKGGKLFIGTFKEVVTACVTKLGFELEEFEFATKEMIDKGHNGAHFGMYRSFMFTFQREFKYDKAS
jgi:hypothetical protein